MFPYSPPSFLYLVAIYFCTIFCALTSKKMVATFLFSAPAILIIVSYVTLVFEPVSKDDIVFLDTSDFCESSSCVSPANSLYFLTLFFKFYTSLFAQYFVLSSILYTLIFFCQVFCANFKKKIFPIDFLHILLYNVVER